MTRRVWRGVAIGALVLVACSGDGGGGRARSERGGGDGARTESSGPTTPETTATTAPPAAPPPVAQLQGVRLRATPIVDTPMLTAMAWRITRPT